VDVAGGHKRQRGAIREVGEKIGHTGIVWVAVVGDFDRDVVPPEPLDEIHERAIGSVEAV
jgi:hypothetical protein